MRCLPLGMPPCCGARLHGSCQQASCPPALSPGAAGGDQIRILNWVFRRGALATQADYPYQAGMPAWLPASPWRRQAGSCLHGNCCTCPISRPVHSAEAPRGYFPSGAEHCSASLLCPSLRASTTSAAQMSRRSASRVGAPVWGRHAAWPALAAGVGRESCRPCFRMPPRTAISPRLPLPSVTQVCHTSSSSPRATAACRALGAGGGRGGSSEGGAADQGTHGGLQ